MRHLARDFRHAWRRLAATPVFTTFAIVTLALGIGVTTGIYSAVRAVLTPPSGVANVDRLVRITRTAGGSGPLVSFSWPDFQAFSSQQSMFDAVAGWSFLRATFASAGRAEIVSTELVSSEYFQALGVSAAQGRTLRASDDAPNAMPVAVMSHGAWQRLFDSAPDVVGQTIKLNGAVVTIVGITQPGFTGLFNGGVVSTAIWIPFRVAQSQPGLGTTVSFDPVTRDRSWIMVLARLAPGRTFEQANAEIVAISTRINAANADFNRAGSDTARSRPRPWIVKRLSEVPKILGADQVVRPMTATLMIAVALVLLVACTNLANLILARTSTRRQEFAVRLSLGASRWRLLRENLSESILLSAVGGAFGLGLARVLMIMLGGELVITRGLAVQLQPRLDLPALVAAIGATLLAMLIAGLGPALQAARADVRLALATDGLATASPRWRGRRYLIAVQVAVSVLLVSIAALCVAQVRDQRVRDVGIDFSRLALVDIDFTRQYDAPRVRQIVDTVLRQIAGQPGVTAVSISSGLPYGIGTPGAVVWSGDKYAPVEYVSATPEIFRALGVAVHRGRGIDARDSAGAAPVVILSELTAERVFGTMDVLGRQVRIRRRQWVGDPEWSEYTASVVGISAAAGRETTDRRSGVIYVPWMQQYEGHVVLAARSEDDPERLLGIIGQILKSTDPETAVTQSLTGSALLAQDTLFFQVVAVIATMLGALALVVALAGLYGVLSFLVSGRTREIGIRVAVGADDRRIRRQVLREGLSPVLMGLVLGFGLGTIARMGMRPMFQRMVPAIDLSAIALVSVLFVVAGLAACYLPARRASRVDPIVALRHL